MRKGSYWGLLGIKIFGFILVDRINIFFRVGISFIFSLYFLSYSFVFYYFLCYFTRIVVIAIFLVIIITFMLLSVLVSAGSLTNNSLSSICSRKLICSSTGSKAKVSCTRSLFISLAGGQFVNACLVEKVIPYVHVSHMCLVLRLLNRYELGR